MKELPNRPKLRVKAVAEFWDVSISCVYNWIAMGIVPAEKKGGSLRIKYEDAEKGKPSIE
jgi:predicted site-specific integrase-resolvase